MGLLDRLFGGGATAQAPEPSHPFVPAKPETRDAIELPAGATPLCDTLIGSSAGISVTPAQALALSAWWACTRAISEDIATLPRAIKRKNGEDLEDAIDHPLWSLIHDEPNDYQSGPQFWEALMHSAVQGNGYAAIVRSNDRPVEMHIMVPEMVSLIIRNGMKVYRYWTARGVMEFLDDEVFHITGPSKTGLWGFDMVSTHRRTIGRTAAMDEYSAKFFERGGAITGVLKVPGVLTAPARENLRKSFNDWHAGLDNAFRIFIADSNSELLPFGMNPESAQLLEGRAFQVEDVARLFRMPPHKIGHLTKSTFANIEQQNIEYATDTIRPWVVKIEAEAERKLLFPSERKNYEIRLDMCELTRGDTAAQTARFESGMKNGYLSINKILRKMGEKPIPGGDVHLVPMNMQTLAQAEAGQPAKTPGAAA